MKEIYKIILNYLTSLKTTLVLLLIFSIALGIATFIEDSYDTITATQLIYKAKWFEVLMILLALNFIGSISKYQLYKRSKWPGLLFHSAFIILIVGGAATRYDGYESTLHVFEGQRTNKCYTDDPTLYIKGTDGEHDFSYNRPLPVNGISNKYFKVKLETKNKGELVIEYKDYLKNAVQTIVENEANGTSVLEFNVHMLGNTDRVVVKKGDYVDFKHLIVSYDNNENQETVQFIEKDNKYFFRFPKNMYAVNRVDNSKKEILKGSVVEINENTIYESIEKGPGISFKKLYHNATVKYVKQDENVIGLHVLFVNISFQGKEQLAAITGGPGYEVEYNKIKIKDLDVEIGFGNREIILPFFVGLNDFTIERYPGSKSPSAIYSDLTLMDEGNNHIQNFTLSMNNVLDYKGYRFFQGSHDLDEGGTSIALNYDRYGFRISYFGYSVMLLGFLLTFFNKRSRYWALILRIGQIQLTKKENNPVLFFSKKIILISIAILTIISTILVVSTLSENGNEKNAYDQHLSNFGKLNAQTYGGRFAPISTVAYDVMHKISKKDKFNIPEIGEVKATQAFIEILINPEFWKQQNIIFIKEQAIQDMLGISGKYASYNDLFTEEGQYKLYEPVNNAYNKKVSDQTIFDKELIKISERAEVFYMTLEGTVLTIFPLENDKNNKWISSNDPPSYLPLSTTIDNVSDDLKKPYSNYNQIMASYLNEIVEAKKTDNYSKADKILADINSIQKQSSSANLLPSDNNLLLENYYNEAQVFVNIKYILSFLIVFLLIFSFVNDLNNNNIRVVRYVLNGIIVTIGFVFLYFTFGMGLMWYLSGHAPWNNGYGTLLFASWSMLFVGFLFARYSRIAFAGIVLLALFTLMTSNLSSYDPQLTNITPVLNSYWLILHVAALTISYGFFGLGFVLGVVVLFLFIFNKNNRFETISTELTLINEMTLTIGLIMAATGTFLGSIWANESWGRYWAWDNKETWTFIIIMIYTTVLHFRLVPKLNNKYIFNIGAILSFATVLMTFFGTNYYFNKGIHNYADENAIGLPIWGWVVLLFLIALILVARIKQKAHDRNDERI